MLLLNPCIPKNWPHYEATVAWQSAKYVITVQNPAQVSRGVLSVTLDGNALPPNQALMMVDDGAAHAVQVVLG
jgi:cyclic beta-1,2-glucan synthetase